MIPREKRTGVMMLSNSACGSEGEQVNTARQRSLFRWGFHPLTGLHHPRGPLIPLLLHRCKQAIGLFTKYSPIQITLENIMKHTQSQTYCTLTHSQIQTDTHTHSCICCVDFERALWNTQTQLCWLWNAVMFLALTVEWVTSLNSWLLHPALVLTLSPLCLFTLWLPCFSSFSFTFLSLSFLSHSLSLSIRCPLCSWISLSHMHTRSHTHKLTDAHSLLCVYPLDKQRECT